MDFVCRQSPCAEAIAVYSEAADGASKLQSAEGRALHAVILANRALCYLKTQQYEQCIQVGGPFCGEDLWHTKRLASDFLCFCVWDAGL